MKKILIASTLLILLTACSEETKEPAPDEKISNEIETDENKASNLDKTEEANADQLAVATENEETAITGEENKLSMLPVDQYLVEMELGFVDTLQHLFGEFWLLLEEFQYDGLSYDVYKEEVSLNLESMSSLIEDLKTIQPQEHEALATHHMEFIEILETNLEIRNLALEALGEDIDNIDEDLLYGYVKPKVRDLERELEAWFTTFWELAE